MYEELVRQLRSMEQLRHKLEIMDSCLEQLSYEDRLILDMLCIHPKSGNAMRLCEALNIEKSSVYRRRLKALAKIHGLFVRSGVGQKRDDF